MQQPTKCRCNLHFWSATSTFSLCNTLDVSADDLLTDNLKHSSSPVNTELHDMLLDCNDDEKDILIKLVKYAKGLLVEHGI